MVNGTQVINDNMPIQPENIIVIVGILLFVGLIGWGIYMFLNR